VSRTGPQGSLCSGGSVQGGGRWAPAPPCGRERPCRQRKAWRAIPAWGCRTWVQGRGFQAARSADPHASLPAPPAEVPAAQVMSDRCRRVSAAGIQVLAQAQLGQNVLLGPLGFGILRGCRMAATWLVTISVFFSVPREAVPHFQPAVASLYLDQQS
jgi:hypothetical protein